jgi:hypothetical protein
VWYRTILIPMRRNFGKGRVATVWDAFGDSVGYLSGREVVVLSMGQRRGAVHVRFADHRESCSAECTEKPSKNFKYVIRGLIRRHR